ncbi:RrF2 family transcriptional regulator [Clostridium peptidivorans]|uniref:RrF2 family transcriptional regulator n=1 Tax=Clostridium peptidivorans TaxID=100174 RepID=UPI000BE415E4|nr:Rrf2 family transcriptional regulator [Clostridium peptidivorans]
MKISTKGIYGLKAILDLATNSFNDVVTLKSISERQNISEGYLEQIFSLLRKRELVKGRKGSQGGYTLVKEPKDVTVGEILRALEGELFQVDVPEEEKDSKIERCIEDKVWGNLRESINQVVDSITLEELVEDYKKYNNEVAMYYI